MSTIKIRQVNIVLALIGLLDSSYLTWLKFANDPRMCIQGLGDCWSVNISRFSVVYGIPIAILGICAYGFLFLLNFFEDRNKFIKNNSVSISFGVTLVGIIYSAFLTYVEIFVIKAICPFCVFSAVIMLSLFIITILRLYRMKDEVEI
jgi:uncharacterized membrane protein